MNKSYLSISFLSFLFFSLGFYHLKFRDAFLVKVGTTHFFTPNVVEILSYAVPVLCIIAATLLWVKGLIKVPTAVIFGLSSSYLLYIWMIYTKTDVTCNCTNIFGSVELKWQALLFTVCALLSAYLFFAKTTKWQK